MRTHHPSPHADADAGLNVPVPDPSILTTAALDREVFALRELIETKLGSIVERITLERKAIDERLNGIDLATVTRAQTFSDRINATIEAEGQAVKCAQEILETRLAGMDKAIVIIQNIADQFLNRVNEKITALKDVHDQKLDAMVAAHGEKFASIQTQFLERDVRTEQAAGAVKIAVDAALQAQKEAAGEQNRSNTLAQTKSETATTKQIDQIGTLIQNNTKSFDDKINDVKDRVNRIEGSGEGGRAMWGYVAGAVGVLVGLAGVLTGLIKLGH